MISQHHYRQLAIILCILCLISPSLYAQDSKIDVKKYITVKGKNSKKFEIFNISGTRLGVVIGDNSPIYLNPRKSKAFSYKKYANASHISLYYEKKDWEIVRDKIISEYQKLKFLYGFVGTGDDIINETRRFETSSSRDEQKRREQQYKTVKNAQKAEFKRNEKIIIDRLKYYGYLYDASHNYNSRRFVPISF